MRETSRIERGFLPDFCSIRVLFLAVLVAELLAIVLSLANSAPESGTLFDLAMKSLFVQWIALSSAGLLCALRSWLEKQGTLPAALLAWGVILLVTAILAELSWFFVPEVLHGRTLHSGEHLDFFLRTMTMSGIVAAIYLRHLYVNRQWHRNVEVVAQSRFRSLQARIRPHFLFNCLNSIAAMIGRHPHDAELAVEDLADLIRVSLDDERNLISLAEELALCKQYLRIEALRLGERLRVQWEVEALPGTAHIPQLTLQPLLENAVYHGVEMLEKGCVVRIEGELAGPGYRVRVSNARAPGRNAALDTGHSLAVENIRRRLQAIYGRQATLELTDSGAQHRACLFIPRLNLRPEDVVAFGQTVHRAEGS